MLSYQWPGKKIHQIYEKMTHKLLMQLELCGSPGMQMENKALTTVVKTIMENLCHFFPVRLFHHTIRSRCFRSSKVSADELGRTLVDLLSCVWT